MGGETVCGAELGVVEVELKRCEVEVKLSKGVCSTRDGFWKG
jgi:hypothetical protein